MAALLLQLLHLLVWLALLAVIFVPLERIFGARPKKTLRRSFSTDLGYYFLNNYLPQALMILPLAFLGWGLHFLTPAQVYVFSGSLPLWARLGAGLVLGDAAYYWAHRLMHQVPFLWRFHAVHHSAEEMDWLVSSRAHPLDVAFGHFIGLVPLYAFGLAQPLGHPTDIAPQLFVIIGVSWSFFIHANLNWRFGWLERLVSTPAFHHWHHTRSDHIDRNYASMLPGLDMIFGTYYLPKQLPAEYGVREPVSADIAGQLIEPFAPRPRPAPLPR
jgi:sterol desaturase/sphingolipid hydroxylase (fatty acid hydroxylase superfamily)